MNTRKALICDDDRTLVRLLRMILAKQGFTVLEAADGACGLAMIRAERPELVLLDLNMPVKDGVAVLTEIQAGGIGGAYIIVLSATDRGELDARVRGLGASELMTKPFNPMEFGRRVERMIAEGKI